MVPDEPVDHQANFLTQKQKDAAGYSLCPGWGNTEAPLMIVGAYPTHDDLENGSMLSASQSGQELQRSLTQAGFKMEDYWITSMYKSGLGSKTKPTGEQIKAHFHYLEAELAIVKPKLIIALGAEPFKRIMKANMGVSKFIGEAIDCPYGCKVMANHAPATVFMFDPTKRPEFDEIFIRAKQILDGTTHYVPFEWMVIDSVPVAQAVVQHYIDTKQFDIGYDAEWFGKKWSDDEVMHTFQFSCEDHKAWILDISKDGTTENRELLDCMKPLICHPEARRMGWNVRADDKRLRHRGFVIPEETLVMDGMKFVALLDSRWAKNLSTGILKFTQYEPYYNDLALKLKEHKLDDGELSKLKFLEPEIFWKYCAGDAVAHRTACLNMLKVMPDRHRKYFNEVYLPFTNYLLDLEITGIPVDQDVMRDITEKYVSKFNELKTKLNELLAKLGIVDFNPNSPPQKKNLLFEVMKLEPVYYTKAGKAAKPRAWYNKQKKQTQSLYSPSTNGKSLSTMVFELKQKMDNLSPESDPGDIETYEAVSIKHNIVHTLLSMNRVGVFANKFLSQRGVDMTEFDPEDFVEDTDTEEGEREVGEEPLKQSYWAALCHDGRIHADFFECLKNFRSSSRPNIQNPASKVLSYIPDIFVPGYNEMSKELKKANEHLIPKNIRNIFYSGHPDYLWCEVDVAGADLMIAAYLSRDPNYIQDMLEGGFHLKKAREYFNDPNVSKDDYSKYVGAKSITFRVAYTAGLESAALPIQAEIFAESGHWLNEDLIKYALGTWRRYTRYMDYRDACTKSALELGYIENARGMRLSFESTDNNSIQASYQNQSLAFPIASELPCFLYDISVQMKRFLQKEGLWLKYVYPVNQVHDASYWLIHKDLMKSDYFAEICKYFFTDKVRIATGDALGMEMNVSDRWKGKNVVFGKETAWNFKTRTWDWKG